MFIHSDSLGNLARTLPGVDDLCFFPDAGVVLPSFAVPNGLLVGVNTSFPPAPLSSPDFLAKKENKLACFVFGLEADMLPFDVNGLFQNGGVIAQFSHMSFTIQREKRLIIFNFKP